MREPSKVIIAKDVATPTVVRVIWDESLQDALEKMARINVNELPVVRQEAPDEIIGMIAKRDIIGLLPFPDRGRGARPLIKAPHTWETLGIQGVTSWTFTLTPPMPSLICSTLAINFFSVPQTPRF